MENLNLPKLALHFLHAHRAERMNATKFLLIPRVVHPSVFNAVHGLGQEDVEKGATLPAIHDLTVAARLKIISEVLAPENGG